MTRMVHGRRTNGLLSDIFPKHPGFVILIVWDRLSRVVLVLRGSLMVSSLDFVHLTPPCECNCAPVSVFGGLLVKWSSVFFA